MAPSLAVGATDLVVRKGRYAQPCACFQDAWAGRFAKSYAHTWAMMGMDGFQPRPLALAAQVSLARHDARYLRTCWLLLLTSCLVKKKQAASKHPMRPPPHPYRSSHATSSTTQHVCNAMTRHTSPTRLAPSSTPPADSASSSASMPMTRRRPWLEQAGLVRRRPGPAVMRVMPPLRLLEEPSSQPSHVPLR